jgi:DNA repair protein RecN (Recombination protein N)
MLERFYLKELLSFNEVALEFHPGLNVFTGPSGSGKSVLMQSILSVMGLSEAKASVGELSVSWQIDEEAHGILNDETNILRQIKKEKVRYFVNSQAISKRVISDFSKKYLKHLSLKDFSDFENDKLIALIDQFAAVLQKEHPQTLSDYQECFHAYHKAKKDLDAIEDEERRIVELKEFTAYEIAKIDEVNPTEGEDESLQQIKRGLSRREKIQEQISEAQAIFNYESHVSAALELLEIESAFFDDTMNELRSHFDDGLSRISELDGVDIEEVLDRIEAISALKRRYGSIEEILKYRDMKRQELEHYETIEITKKHLSDEVKSLHVRLQKYADRLSQTRQSSLKALQEKLNTYLSQLYLRDATLELQKSDLTLLGYDAVQIQLNATSLSALSSGEFNRLRLALLAVHAEFLDASNGVLMLDEIDANLSGEESMSVAKVLRRLSRIYQIFVISHQPQLTSMGEQHFLISKDEFSHVRILNDEERINEISRMISGERISDEARIFAKDLLRSAQCASS